MKKRIQILIIVILYALMFVPLSAQTPHTISGIVKDRASVPISGVNIRVEGQKWKASTGKEGKFTLKFLKTPPSPFPLLVMSRSPSIPVRRNG